MDMLNIVTCKFHISLKIVNSERPESDIVATDTALHKCLLPPRREINSLKSPVDSWLHCHKDYYRFTDFKMFECQMCIEYREILKMLE